MKPFLLFFVSIAVVAGGQPDFPALKARIRQLLDQHEYAAALEQGKAVNKQWADDVPTYQLIAEAALGVGDYKEADTALQWMLDLRIGKADSTGWWLLARFREVTGDVEGAIEAMNNGIPRAQNEGSAHVPDMFGYLAHLQLAVGRVQLTEKLLASANPSAPETALVRARLLLAQSHRDGAIRVLRDLTAQNKDPRYLYALADVSDEAADYAAFERSARERLRSSDNANPELAIYLAGRGKQPAEALEIARSEAQRRHDVATQDALAVALAATGKKADAVQVMKAVLEVGTRAPSIVRHATELGISAE